VAIERHCIVAKMIRVAFYTIANTLLDKDLHMYIADMCDVYIARRIPQAVQLSSCVHRIITIMLLLL